MNHSEQMRRARDRGRTSRAWRWFSRRTIHAGRHYHDLSWRTVAVQAGLSAGLIALSRIDPGFALAPWMLIAGVVWAVLIARIALLKLSGPAQRG
ncbi:hypothetical protein F1654_09890 [Alkalicaulis satelles]|uniref:Uncharacterized protein n=1 Tax=Alkalicaulis satelles TaxID=2609175 RepID=A0A5M6ZK72_9PROT|nr:hypothetical protein [Alkalicaulis satelles]KAA5804077.1 hypothetical protein F1654_09890 [Alkalicaulis satelles]